MSLLILYVLFSQWRSQENLTLCFFLFVLFLFFLLCLFVCFFCHKLCVHMQVNKGLFTWRWGTPGKWGKIWRITPPIMYTWSNLNNRLNGQTERNLKGTVLLSVITDQVYWENKIYELKRSISDTYRHLGVFIQRFDIYVPWSLSRLGRTTKALIYLHNNLHQFADQEHYTKLIGKTSAGGSICLQLNTVTPECCRWLSIKHIKYIKPLFEQ